MLKRISTDEGDRWAVVFDEQLSLLEINFMRIALIKAIDDELNTPTDQLNGYSSGLASLSYQMFFDANDIDNVENEIISALKKKGGK